MRLPRVQFTVRRLMVVVAVSAVLLAARDQVARSEDKRRRYEILSDIYSENPFDQWADLTHDQWLAKCGEVDELNRKGHLMLGLTLIPPRAGRRPPRGGAVGTLQEAVRVGLLPPLVAQRAWATPVLTPRVVYTAPPPHGQAGGGQVRLRRAVTVQPDVAPLLRFRLLERLSAAVVENGLGAVVENHLVLV